MTVENKDSKEFISIKPFVDITLKYWYIFLISFVVCGGIGLSYYILKKPTYNILANVLIKENKSSVGGMQAAMMKSLPFGNILGGSTGLNDEIYILSSHSTLKDVASELALNENYKLKDFPFNKLYYTNSPIKLVSSENIADTLMAYLKFNIHIDSNGSGKVKAYIGSYLKKNIGELTFDKLPAQISTLYGSFEIVPTPFYEKGEEYDIKAAYYSYDLAAQFLQEEIVFDIVTKKANVINMSLLDKDIVRGKDILNTTIDIYNGNGLKKKLELTNKTVAFLNERLNVVEEELLDLEKQIETYKNNNDLVDLEEEAKAILANATEYKKQLIETETQLEIVDWVSEFVLDPKNKYALIPLNIGLSDKNVLEGLQQYNNLLLTRTRLQINTHEINPTIEAYNEQLEIMRDNLILTIKNLKAGLMFARNDLKKQEDFFNSRLKKMPKQEREFVEIKRQQLLKQELYLYLMEKKEENSLAVAIPDPKSDIIDYAYVQKDPVSPNLKMILVFTVLGGFFLSILYIALKERKRFKIN